jgi:hypothetical protein
MFLIIKAMVEFKRALMQGGHRSNAALEVYGNRYSPLASITFQVDSQL